MAPSLFHSVECFLFLQSDWIPPHLALQELIGTEAAGHLPAMVLSFQEDPLLHTRTTTILAF